MLLSSAWEASVRKGFLLLAMFILLAPTAHSQLIKTVPIKAGTSEDKALDEISNAADPAQKLALIDKFYADFGKGELAVTAGDLYVSYYSDAKNYPKVAEYAQNILVLDPDNFSAALQLIHADYEVGDAPDLLDVGEKFAGILARYKAQTPPAGADAASWKTLHDQSLADQQDQIAYVESLLSSILYKVQSPAERAAAADRAVAAFPDSSYAAMDERLAAVSYQQAENTPKMIAAAEKALILDPNSIDMLLLLGDQYSSNANQLDGGLLDKAEAYSKKALALLAGAKKPEGIPEAQWQSKITLQTGLAWTEQGQIRITRNDFTGAAAAFQKASPLLKADTSSYARNLYRLGVAYSRMKKIPEARAALAEAASLDTPFKMLAEQALQQIAPATPPKRSGRGTGN